MRRRARLAQAAKPAHARDPGRARHAPTCCAPPPPAPSRRTRSGILKGGRPPVHRQVDASTRRSCREADGERDRASGFHRSGSAARSQAFRVQRTRGRASEGREGARPAVKLVITRPRDPGLRVKGQLARQLSVREHIGRAPARGGGRRTCRRRATRSPPLEATGVTTGTHVILGSVNERCEAVPCRISGYGASALVYSTTIPHDPPRHHQRRSRQLIKSSVEGRARSPHESVDRKRLSDYSIFEVDGNPIACVALHPARQRRASSPASTLRPTHENRGIGPQARPVRQASAREPGYAAARSRRRPSASSSREGRLRRGAAPTTCRPAARRTRYDQSGRRSGCWSEALPAARAGVEPQRELRRNTTPAHRRDPRASRGTGPSSPSRIT